MDLRDCPQGKLDFINVTANYIKEKYQPPRFECNGKYLSSEEFAIEYFKSLGFNAFFAENSLWQSLLVCLFAEEMKREPGHFPKLSNIGHYLYDDVYFNENKEKYLKRLDYLKEANLTDELRNYFKKPSNRLIELCNHMDSEKLLNVLYYMIQDYNSRKKGFPDLFVFDDNQSFFCEIKANTDTLSYVQIKKHEVLLDSGIDVVLFTINKNKKWFFEQKEKYFNEGLFRRTNFIDNYDSEIYHANKVYVELENEGIEEFREEFLKNYDIDAFIAFLNIIDEYSFNEKLMTITSFDQTIINESLEKGKVITEKRILKNGKILEDKKKYREAIAEYSKVDNFKAYKRIIICYRKLKDYENELNLIYAGINNPNFNKQEHGSLKRRLKRFFKNKKDYNQIQTDCDCPHCGSAVVLNDFKTRSHIKFYTCLNDNCYWFGGIYK